MAVYNTTFLENSTNIVQIFTGFSTSIGNPYLFGYLILASFSIVFFVATSRTGEITKMWSINLFLTTILGMLLAFAELVNWAAVALPFALFIMALITHFST